MNLSERIKRYGLKAGVLFVGFLGTFYIPYVLLGIWNRIFGGWTSVFYCYAGSSNFIDTYAPGMLTRAYRWFPVPIGILQSDGSRGIVIASPVSEKDFLDPEQHHNFLKLQRRIRLIGRLMGVSRISLSGILPGVVGQHGVLTLRDSRPVVKNAVRAAVKHVIAADFSGTPTPILLLGGAGHIGVPIAEGLRNDGMVVHVIDPKCGDSVLPEALRGQPCLVVDCSRAGAIRRYVDQMWPGMVLLNEVFPRTPRKVVDALSEKGVPCWHLSGLLGSIQPPLPHGYEGAVPCCAAHGAEDEAEVVMVRLNPNVERFEGPMASDRAA